MPPHVLASHVPTSRLSHGVSCGPSHGPVHGVSHIPTYGPSYGPSHGPTYGASHVPVDVFVTSECIHLYILCLLPRCLFWEVSIM